jgi:hypothetical protein
MGVERRGRRQDDEIHDRIRSKHAGHDIEVHSPNVVKGLSKNN